jgi:2-keto-3-deoxy-L-rhamnonate aldolase RhmA
MIGIMIENVEAARNIEMMMSLEGVDFALFGPADLSMSMGLRRLDQNDPGVQEVLANTIEIAKKLGKYVMFDNGTDLDDICRPADKGITMFEPDYELSIVRSVWSDRAKLIEGLK